MAIRIRHLISSLDIGGAERSLLQLLSTIDRKRFECSVTSLISPGPIAGRMEQLEIPVNSLGMKRGRVSLGPILELADQLRREHIQILMTWLYHADLLGIMAGKLARVPFIVWNLRAAEMDMTRYPKLSGWTRRLCSRLSTFPDAVVVNSVAGKIFHSKIGYRPRAWFVIKNAIDMERFKPDPIAREQVRKELNIQPQDLVVGMVARFDPMKDHDSFVAAARMVASRSESVRFVLVGNSVTPGNARFSSVSYDPLLAGRVHLLGEREDVPRLMAAFDVACSSSRSEAFPNAVAEAMACGLLCVATKVGDSADLIGDNGILVPPGDPEALAHALLQAIEMEPAKRQALGCAARAQIMKSFTLERFASEYERLFVQIARSLQSRPT